MLRASLAVSILLASLFFLSYNLLRNDAENGVVVPQLLELRVDDIRIINDATGDTSSLASGKIALVTNIEDLDVATGNQPSVNALAQRWGGRPLQRLRNRTNSSNRRSASRTLENSQGDTDKPIASPPHILPDRNRLEILKDSREVPKGSGESDLIDPAEPRRQAATHRPTPTKSQSAKSSPAKTLPKQSAGTELPSANTTAQPEANGYYDADWYRITKLNKNSMARRDRIRKCLDHYYRRPLNSQEHSPWSLMHTMIAWGSDSYIRAGGARGRSVGTAQWLGQNGLSDGVRLLYVKNGELKAKTGPGLQGHDGQLLAMLAQTRIRADYPIRVDNRDFEVRDLIAMEKETCRGRMELTFKLIGLAHYLHPDDSWQAQGGATWDISKLIKSEIAAPINGVTCGGTHRLMGLSYAVRMRRKYGLPVSGQWARAEKYTSDHVNLAFRLQNSDGTFSTNFFRGKENRNDMDRKLKTTGHLLEWIVYSVPHERLQDRRITRAVDQLTNLMMSNRYYDWPKGPIGHAIRALSLYNERVFNIPPGTRRGKSQMASRRANSRNK